MGSLQKSNVLDENKTSNHFDTFYQATHFTILRTWSKNTSLWTELPPNVSNGVIK